MGGARRVGDRARGNGDCATRRAQVAHPGAYPLLEHERHTAAVLELELGAGRAAAYATCFTPGLARTAVPLPA